MPTVTVDIALKGLADQHRHESWYVGARTYITGGRRVLVLMVLDRPPGMPTEYRGYPVLIESHTAPARAAL
ncbi:MAG: hypothetical protein H6733_04995 [Alphaproteobacteria bacterium]|nr:hypothetical protein [Alphaproteobacteria bacterium]